jgi:hypothetical protein
VFGLWCIPFYRKYYTKQCCHHDGEALALCPTSEENTPKYAKLYFIALAIDHIGSEKD